MKKPTVKFLPSWSGMPNFQGEGVIQKPKGVASSEWKRRVNTVLKARRSPSNRTLEDLIMNLPRHKRPIIIDIYDNPTHK